MFVLSVMGTVSEPGSVAVPMTTLLLSVIWTALIPAELPAAGVTESAAMLVQSSPLWPSTMTAPSLPALVGVKPVMGPMFWAAALLLIAPRSAIGLTRSAPR